MKILAIDSGLEKTGFAIFNKEASSSKKPYRFITSGLIKTSKTDLKEERFSLIYTKLGKIIQQEKPHLIILEQLFFYKNAKTVIDVAQSQGVIYLLAAQQQLPVITMTPLQIKEIITGYGRSDKDAVKKMLALTLGIELTKMEDDESDAIACGLAYCYLNEKLLE